MADEGNVESGHHLTMDTPPQQIPKDVTGFDNAIPLSPQWLLPKPGDNKPGMIAVESHFSPCHGNHPDAVKTSGNGEELHDAEKRSIAFRSSFHDAETGRHNRWREEEREMNFTVRRDRWRDGERDKEAADNRRERRTDNSSRLSGEVRWAPSDRWNGSGNRDTNFEQRRESKWNTRWGPDDKESDGWREKRIDSGRDGEGSHDKGTLHQTNPGKDADKEGDHYSRPWRPNSSLTRGRGDSSLTPIKQGQTFGSGRGRGENGLSIFSAGRGKSNSIMGSNNGTSHAHFVGTLPDKPVGVHGDSSVLRYSRMKLLDIYRVMDIKSNRKQFDGFVEVPSLTQFEPLEPLAISVPSPEELVVLKGIDKGDIVSSCIPQVTKDVSVGRNPVDTVILRHANLGEDLSSAMDNSKVGISDNSKDGQQGYLDDASYERHMHPHGPDLKVDLSQNFQSHDDGILTIKASRSEGANPRKTGEAAVRGVSMLDESSSFQHTMPWRSETMGENSSGLAKDWKELSVDARSRTSDVGWLHLQKDQEAKWMSNDVVSSSSYGNKLHWQNNEQFQSEMSKDLRFKRHSSEVLDRERETDKMLGHDDSFISRDKVTARKFHQQPSLEELLLYYKDPQGQIQGPFSGSDLLGWFEAGYFGIDLQVRLADASPDAPFLLLGDVMPHLRMKARPPPGFSVHKQIEAVDASIRGKLASQGNIRAGLGEVEYINSGQRNRHDSSTEVENRFLESLMSGNMSNPADSFSFPEGVKGYASNTSAAMSTVAREPGYNLNYLLAHGMSLEQQGSLPNHLPFWSGKDRASMPPNQEFVLNSPSQNSKLIPPMVDIPGSIPQVSQHVDLLSILQATAEKGPSPAVNNSVPIWPKFPDARSLNKTVRSGMDIPKDSIEVHHNQHFASQAGYGIQPQRLQQLNQPSLSPMISQSSDHPSNFVPPEKLLSSEIPQDPNLLSMLQQQYLLSQLQLQSQMPLPTQLSLLDKFLLMKEQQKQEQQQLLLQQQHLLSRILSEHQSQQQFGESPYGHLQTTGSVANALSGHMGLQQPLESVQINEQMEALSLQDGRASNLSNLPMQVSQDLDCVIGSSQSALLAPHQLSDHMTQSKEWVTSTQQIENTLSSDSVPSVMAADSSFPPVATEKSSQEAHAVQDTAPDVAVNVSRHGGETVELVASGEINSFVSLDGSLETSKHAFPVSQEVDLKSVSENICERSPSQSLPVKNVKPVEGPGVKKVSDKKSRKQKNAKAQSASEMKGSSKSANLQQLKLDPEIGVGTGGLTSVTWPEEQESLCRTTPLRVTDGKSVIANVEAPSSQELGALSAKHVSGDEVETAVSKTELREGEYASQLTMQIPVQQAWKPAPAPKAKSLLEIQQEEQQMAQTEMFVSDIVASSTGASSFSSTPWAGVVAGSDHKPVTDVLQGGTNAQLSLSKSGEDSNLTCRKSQLHDLLSEEVIVKSTKDVADSSTTVGKSFLVSPAADVKTQIDGPFFNDDDFVEAKDMKKSRKKTAKAKGAGVKSSVPISLADLTASIPTEKGKSACQAQQDKELSSVLPTGPSLGDFVFWKGDQIDSAPAPAWSTDSLRAQKPTPLRDILKEQEENMASAPKQIPVVGSSKAHQSRNIYGSSSRQISGTSPSTASSPIKNSSLSALTKSKTEEDLFWGPLDQPKQESKQVDFPSLATSSSRGTKGTLLKTLSGVAPVRPKASGRPEYALATSPVGQPFLKAGRDALSKYSEAMDFRAWCEGEVVRLTGAQDTGFLEFCLMQPTSEAKTLLRENLGPLDPDYEFIDKFLDYKELLPADVIEIAFQSPHQSLKVDGVGTNCGNADVRADNADADMLARLDGPAKGGGKKKGKKGKKVSPSALGFNVVSNRIMMGEIQSVED